VSVKLVISSRNPYSKNRLTNKGGHANHSRMPAFIETHTYAELLLAERFVYFASLRIQAKRSVGADRFEVKILDDGA
jgi:hypothetical protein